MQSSEETARANVYQAVKKLRDLIDSWRAPEQARRQT
jgi:DNA-binding SARP family transcriptional activator